MKPVDLVPFAEHSEKLPTELLRPEASQKKTTAWEVLTAHMIDFVMVFALTSFMAAIFSLSVKGMMVTKGLKAAFTEQMVFGVSGTLLPVVVFTYFFFSYFMNHGQTWGMFLLKKRMEMKAKSFMDALKSASHSVILCFSCGISFMGQKSVWNKFKGHDYLYEDLFTHKDSDSIDLLARIDAYESQKVMEVNVWKKAA